jgi:hypothetical protein
MHDDIRRLTIPLLPLPDRKEHAPAEVLANDLLLGAAAIAGFTGFTTRQIYHFAAKGLLPIGHVGALLVARKSQLTNAVTVTKPPPELDPIRPRRAE